ncbi:MAG: WGR domain-containing protein [Bacteroidia bacterium]|nr:WGR domain-containing protein [Bacteroidia bacterium]
MPGNYAEDINLIIYGKVNTKEQKLNKIFETNSQAHSEMKRLIQQKLRKGYSASDIPV